MQPCKWLVLTEVPYDLLFFTASSSLSGTKALKKTYSKASYLTQTSRWVLGKSYTAVTSTSF